MLSCRTGHSRLRHFLDDFGECCFGRFVSWFAFLHIVNNVTGANRAQANLEQAQHHLTWYSNRRGGYYLLLFQVF